MALQSPRWRGYCGRWKVNGKWRAPLNLRRHWRFPSQQPYLTRVVEDESNLYCHVPLFARVRQTSSQPCIYDIPEGSARDRKVQVPRSRILIASAFCFFFARVLIFNSLFENGKERNQRKINYVRHGHCWNTTINYVRFLLATRFFFLFSLG
ncbi:hypothetical protein M433DRAFT_526109 [Acidomyces richmondensis BFW]|nr:MAG: hypothetical protein FE78DRAFT_280792 [Acidomyces sp. 'richmondensis']KYG46971.1 hypothetical protein M433DRAFT_526109 [Acidomyces richmondensis BFW]